MDHYYDDNYEPSDEELREIEQLLNEERGFYGKKAEKDFDFFKWLKQNGIKW